MKKFMQISLCVAILNGAVLRTHAHDGVFNNATDAAKGAGVATIAALLATEKGRNTLTNIVNTVTRDQKGELNTTNLGAAGAAGVAAYLLQQYELHNYLRKVPAVGDTVADFVDDHKYGVATGAAIVVLYVLNQMASAAS